MTHQLTVVLLRVSVVVGLLWGSIGRDPLPLGIGCLCLLAWILIRSRGYASFSHATIWRVRLLGVGALLAAPICFAVPIAIGAGGFGLTENKHAWALWLIAALFGLGAWGAYELAIFGLGAITASGQLARRDALSELASDPRAPILYLRAFTEDERSVDAQSSGIGGKWVGEAFNQETLIQFEDALVGRLSRYGPVIAIAEPGAIPTGSASRAYFGDDWQHRVLQWMARAKLVVVVAGNSPGVRWELQQVVARDLLSKTILVLPPTDASSRNWPELWQACLGTPWQAAVPCLKQPAIRAAYVARDGRAVCFKSEKGNNLGYGLAIEFAIFGVKLRDAYHRRGAP